VLRRLGHPDVVAFRRRAVGVTSPSICPAGTSARFTTTLYPPLELLPRPLLSSRDRQGDSESATGAILPRPMKMRLHNEFNASTRLSKAVRARGLRPLKRYVIPRLAYAARQQVQLFPQGAVVLLGPRQDLRRRLRGRARFFSSSRRGVRGARRGERVGASQPWFFSNARTKFKNQSLMTRQVRARSGRGLRQSPRH
jgi:hypothetical protein